MLGFGTSGLTHKKPFRINSRMRQVVEPCGSHRYEIIYISSSPVRQHAQAIEFRQPSTNSTLWVFRRGRVGLGMLRLLCRTEKSNATGSFGGNGRAELTSILASGAGWGHHQPT